MPAGTTLVSGDPCSICNLRHFCQDQIDKTDFKWFYPGLEESFFHVGGHKPKPSTKQAYSNCNVSWPTVLSTIVLLLHRPITNPMLVKTSAKPSTPYSSISLLVPLTNKNTAHNFKNATSICNVEELTYSQSLDCLYQCSLCDSSWAFTSSSTLACKGTGGDGLACCIIYDVPTCCFGCFRTNLLQILDNYILLWLWSGA